MPPRAAYESTKNSTSPLPKFSTHGCTRRCQTERINEVDRIPADIGIDTLVLALVLTINAEGNHLDFLLGWVIPLFVCELIKKCSVNSIGNLLINSTFPYLLSNFSPQFFANTFKEVFCELNISVTWKYGRKLLISCGEKTVGAIVSVINYLNVFHDVPH